MDISNFIAFFGLIVAITGLLITLLKEWKYIRPKIQDAILLIVSFDHSKRKFLLFIGVIGTISVFAFLKKFSIPHSQEKSPILSKLSNSKLIVNNRTGVVHHSTICFAHLPKNNSNILHNKNFRIHKAKKFAIIDCLITELPDEVAVGLLIDTIKDSPTSTHLYKYLLKIWGRNKEYDKIHQFLEINIKYLTAKAASSSRQKVIEKYKKAVAELQARKNRAEYFANISKII